MLGLALVLPTIYLSATVDPQGELRDLPIAISGSGLGDAWIRIAIGGAIGLALGLLATAIYDKIPRFSRHPQPDQQHIPARS